MHDENGPELTRSGKVVTSEDFVWDFIRRTLLKRITIFFQRLPTKLNGGVSKLCPKTKWLDESFGQTFGSLLEQSFRSGVLEVSPAFC